MNNIFFQQLKCLKMKSQLKFFSTKTNFKSIYSKKKNPIRTRDPDINESNTIDITKSQKEYEDNSELEIKNLNKIINRNTVNNDTMKQEVNIKKESRVENVKTDDETHHNLDLFKKRNKEIFRNERNKKIEINEEENLSKDKSSIDEKTLSKLQELIKSDTMNSENPNEDIQFESKVDTHFDDEKNYLVNRPSKNFVWGLGQQTKQKKFKFIYGELPTLDSIVSFLEINKIDDIIIVPTHKLGLKHLKENSILCSGKNSRHVYKVAKDLVVELKKLNISNLPFIPTVFGRRDSEWLLIEIGEIQIHFFVETYRKEMDLLDIWLNPPEEEFIDWQKRVDYKYYGKKKF